MNEPDEWLETVRGWVAKADNDLTAAAQILRLGRDCPADTVCFHVQQCVEKYFKALLVAERVDFPKTHDLNALARLRPEALLDALTDLERRRMTEYATVIRYPNEESTIPFVEARKAVATARRIRKAIRQLLPKASLRRRKS